jgi:hypothetical protein
VASEGYLHEVLADGGRTFRYRCRLRELLGLTFETGIRVDFAHTTWPLGFVYLARSPGAGESSDARSSWLDVPATTPVRADSWTPKSSLGVRTPSSTQGLPRVAPEKTALKNVDAPAHNGPGALQRPLDAAVAADPESDRRNNTDGAGAPSALADLAVPRHTTTPSTAPVRLGTPASVGPESSTGSAPRPHGAVPTAAPTSSSPRVFVPGRTTQASRPGEVALPHDTTAVHNGPSPASTGTRPIPVAAAAGPGIDRTANAEGSSAPTAFGDRAVRLAETYRREPVPSGDHPGKRAPGSMGRSQARSRAATRPIVESIHRTTESPRSAAVADPPTGPAPAPGDQRHVVIVANPGTESIRVAAFWERRHINWLRLRSLR